MLTIRLTRVGKRKYPLYRLIISEKSRDPWGKALEQLGTYQPHRKPAIFEFKKDRVEYWISKGAQCSDTVRNMLIDQGVIKGEKRKLAQLSKRRKEKLAKKSTS